MTSGKGFPAPKGPAKAGVVKDLPANAISVQVTSSPQSGLGDLTQVQSPLSGVDPRSLDAIMAKDVEDMSEGDVEQLCLALRAQRATWAANDALAQEAKLNKRTAPKGAKPKGGGTLRPSLADLFKPKG